MKKRSILLFFLVLFVTSQVFGIPFFGMSKAEIAEAVKDSMQERLDNDSNLSSYHMIVKSVDVLKVTGNAYKGYAHIEYKGAIHDVIVNITVDGDSVGWEAPAGSFAFLFAY